METSSRRRCSYRHADVNEAIFRSIDTAHTFLTRFVEGIDLYISHLKNQHLGLVIALLPHNLFLIIGGGGLYSVEAVITMSNSLYVASKYILVYIPTHFDGTRCFSLVT